MAMRISGLSSGMDIDSIVDGLMKAERAPLNKVEKKLQTLEWQRDDYRAMNTALLNFSNEVSSMQYTNKYRSYSVASTDSSKVTATAANNANVGQTTISNVTLATSASIVGAATGYTGQTSDTSLDNLVGKQLTIGAETFTVEAGDTIKSIIGKVNASNAGVNMYYDYVKGKFSITNKETGAGTINVSGELADTFGLGTGATKTDGKNATLTINGIETERTSNTFTENGVTYTLNSEFTGFVTTTVKTDTDSVVDNIVSFVNKYNELISTIQDKLKEERNRNYGPLTDEEREALSEKEIEKWESIAKTGLLRNDQTLSNILSNMRLDFYSQVNNDKISADFNHLAKIGITTSPNYKDGGKLVIDEEKLRAAINADSQSVEQLFRGENGLMSKLSATLKTGMGAIKSKAGNENTTNQQFSIGKELESLNKSKTRWEDRLKQIESKYWSKFTQMEKLISNMNSQSSTLSSYFS
ncbi:flagellar hook-associated protein 2 [Bacillus sp. AGMB 02131]|uniref:Flagellar hook-associated protein 2 n=1 Tax=Peribacillus faecalis TaxID=2772559 RepID=A0A927CWR6_9BACI|nr:flagellar hook-associated protein 2 [Peribacillus faecalis]MBD3108491.1 flagellar hook-associated protein 2 [Peribacillus faecalis]